MIVDAPAVDGELDLHLCFFSNGFTLSSYALVVALESFGHEQLPEVLRGEFLHVLAVVVNLPCWRGAACIHTPPFNTTHTHPAETYVQTHTYTQTNKHAHLYKHKQAEEGKKTAAQHQISGERSKWRDQNAVRGWRAECCQTAGKQEAERQTESINFKLM